MNNTFTKGVRPDKSNSKPRKTIQLFCKKKEKRHDIDSRPSEPAIKHHTGPTLTLLLHQPYLQLAPHLRYILSAALPTGGTPGGGASHPPGATVPAGSPSDSSH